MKKLQLLLAFMVATSTMSVAQVLTINQPAIGGGWYSGWDELGAQSFTITQAGYITEIRFYTYTPEGMTTVEIRQGQDVSGPLLYSTSVDVNVSGWISVPVPNIPVCEGMYCFTQSGWQWGATNNSDPYPGGSYYYVGSWVAMGDQPFEIWQTINEQPSAASALSNMTVCAGNTPSPTVFTISDETPSTVVVSASSSNTSVIPNGALTVSGGGSSRTLTIAGPLSTPGTTTITLSLSDANCTGTETFNVQVVPAPTVSAGPDQAICVGNTVTLSGSGANFYSWNLGVTDAVPFSPGVGTTTYTVTGTDLNGCTSIDAANVTVYALPSVSFASVPLQCLDGSVSTLTQGTPAGGTYSGPGISGNNFSPMSVGAGSFSVSYTYTDVNSCTNSAGQIITVNDVPSITFTSPADVCVNSAPVTLTTASPAGGTYSGTGVSGSSFDPAVTGTGPQSLLYIYTDGVTTCTNTANATINVLPPPTVNGGPPFVTVCEGDPVTLYGGGTAVSYTWDNGVTDGVAFTPAIGTTTYTVTGSNGTCQNTASVDVTVNALPGVSFAVVPSLCANGSGYLLTEGTPSGGGYSGVGVSGNSFDPSMVGVGTYAVDYTYIDVNGCTNTASQTILVNDLPALNFPPMANVCENTAPFLLNSATPAGGTYFGSGVSGSTFDPSMASGTVPITYTYTDGSTGCTNSINQNITVHPLVIVIPNATQMSVCDGQTTTLYGSNAASYTWDNGVVDNVPFAPPVGTTVYTVTGTDVNGCQTMNTIAINVNALPLINAGTDFTICQGASATLNGSGGVSYLWNNGVTDAVAFVPPVGATTYTVTGTDANSCQGTDDVIITVTSLPILVVSPDQFFCEGETVTLTVSGASAYNWNSGAGTASTFDISPVSNTTVQVVGTTAGCSSTETITLTFDDPSQVDAGTDAIVCKGYITYLNASGGVSYTWNGPGVDNATAASHGFLVDTTAYYYLTAVTAEGCTYIDSVLITANMDPSCTIEPLTTFSPNGDAVNESWKIQGIESFPENHVTVLNRWGDIVFDQNNYDNETVIWNGTLANGGEAPAGTYYFIVEIANGPSTTGWIQLLK